jgi:hypothetical protein
METEMELPWVPQPDLFFSLHLDKDVVICVIVRPEPSHWFQEMTRDNMSQYGRRFFFCRLF